MKSRTSNEQSSFDANADLFTEIKHNLQNINSNLSKFKSKGETKMSNEISNVYVIQDGEGITQKVTKTEGTALKTLIKYYIDYLNDVKITENEVNIDDVIMDMTTLITYGYIEELGNYDKCDLEE